MSYSKDDFDKARKGLFPPKVEPDKRPIVYGYEWNVPSAVRIYNNQIYPLGVSSASYQRGMEIGLAAPCAPSSYSPGAHFNTVVVDTHQLVYDPRRNVYVDRRGDTYRKAVFRDGSVRFLKEPF
jgi:hypothetical protein